MNTPLIVVTITRANMAKALAMFEERPDLVDHTMTDHTTGLDRVQAETAARRMVMSSCLAVELGLTPQQSSKSCPGGTGTRPSASVGTTSATAQPSHHPRLVKVQ